MDKKLKILIVEDTASDLELLVRELKKGYPGHVAQNVETEQGFVQALETFLPDIILSDYSLPTFDGLKAFKLKQQISPSTPFIIVSGNIGDENAVDMIKNGVTDYVLKDKMYSLTPRIERALREAKELEDKHNAEAEIIKLNAELEERIKLRTAELELANEQLESFTSTVSHDLRIPLQLINGNASLLSKKYENDLNDDAQRLLKGIKQHTVQMGRLIDDLLRFSKVRNVELTQELVDMNELVKAVLTELKPTFENLGVQIKLDVLKPGIGDKNLLYQVWLNLISNAIKYSRKEKSPVIEIGTRQIDGQDAYYIKDNGVGFDMKSYDKLFREFQRLHHPADFEGTGVGLALVRNVINRHGGKVWAEGKVGKGATFYFSLPGGTAA